jgi:ABC-type amino acid transport substrate-binding protein
LALLQIAKVTEEAIEEAREKVMTRSGRIGHHLVVKQFIFEIIERAKSMTARDSRRWKFAFSSKYLFASSVFAAPFASPSVG